MDKEIFLNEFGHLAQGPDGIKNLRDLILQLAVQGKLVEQDSNDEPASVLLEKVESDIQVALKEKTIRKNRLFDVEDSQFKDYIPESWLTLTVSQIVNVFNGNSVSASDKKSKYTNVTEGYNYIATKDVDFKSHQIDYNNGIKIPFETPKFKIAPKGAVLICAEGGSAGKKLTITDENICFGNKLYASVPITSAIDNRFLFYVYKSPLFIFQFQEAMTGIIGGISQTSFLALSVPLPPLAEQKHIAAKVDELMALCDELEASQEAHKSLKKDCVASSLHHLSETSENEEIKSNWSIAEGNFNSWFDDLETVKNLRATILQLAVQGKLVEQDPNDEPAILLKQKAEIELAALVSEKKVRVQKGISPFNEEGWPASKSLNSIWCKYGEISAISSGVTKGRKLEGRKLITVPYLRVANVQRGWIDITVLKEIEIPADELDKFALMKGDVLQVEGGDWDKVGRAVVWENPVAPCVHQNHIFKSRPLGGIIPKYVELFMNSPMTMQYFQSCSKQTTNLASINKTQLSNTPFLLPPLEEQKRIVAKVDELMALCDQLESQIQSSDDLNKDLMASLVHHMSAA
ncbi:putative Type I restriction modification DNA specificity domain protein [Candidatus Terasakiella magnetica]|uniref:Putative Type I restriction modification DNA specificity domain protein n=1 Tax=Candidatus Terasakiella magnetica TaxID=1867952 RepID=A0A1C3RFF6_9PROT|nr:restriction endonuclease subunit S [Candidatus Terasakiella magnetica]SCA55944.1 putative Type I restriction modification DNA specificity domain protein [Candidatus Terasakiella magnetica]